MTLWDLSYGGGALLAIIAPTTVLADSCTTALLAFVALTTMLTRDEVALELQGVQRLSARSSALKMQGVRWGINMRARSSAHSV